MQVSEAFTAFVAVADAEPRLACAEPWLPAMASRPGGRFAMTIWGDVGKSPGGWMFRPFLWAEEEKVENQAKMVSFGQSRRVGSRPRTLGPSLRGQFQLFGYVGTKR
jgi:hypothetical protein